MTDIYLVTCVFKIPSTSIQLQFMTAEAARDVFDKLTPSRMPAWRQDEITQDRLEFGIETVTDYYGAVATIDCSQLAAVLFENASRKLDAQTEIALMQNEAQVKAQRRAQAANGSIVLPQRQ